MNLSELFIRRPVMTSLVMMGIVIFGLLSYVGKYKGSTRHLLRRYAAPPAESR
jgi:hypothetical protein